MKKKKLKKKNKKLKKRIKWYRKREVSEILTNTMRERSNAL